MPTYEYACHTCNSVTEVIKSIRYYDTEEKCSKCCTIMEKLITAVNLNHSVCHFEPHFNYGLGKVVTSKRSQDEALRRLRGETGKDIVEIGNDDLKSIKRQRHEYTIDNSIRLRGGI